MLRSLVSYSSESEEEKISTSNGFDDFEASEKPSTSTKKNDLVEPEPPRRPLEENEGDYDSLDLEADLILEEGLNNAELQGSMTPTLDSGGDETPRVQPIPDFDSLKLPPSPTTPCDPEMQKKFESYFQKKSLGIQMNEQIKKNIHFKNPAIYEYLVNEYNIDEKGTNFPKEIFDPHCFDETDFYDSLGILFLFINK